MEIQTHGSAASRRRRCLLAAAAVCLASLLAVPAVAQSYPQRAITLIAPFAPGGSADGIARILARELSAALGQPVVVDNRPGAGGATGLLAVARANPDGYTLGMGATGALTIAPHLPDATPLKPQQQLQPLARVADIPLVLVSSPASGIHSLQDLMARARREDLSVGNSGQYTAHHLSVELLASMAGLRLVSVPYRGSGPAVTDLMGGQVPAALVDLTSVIAQVKAGRAQALAVTSARRTALAPDVPTMAEADVPGYEAPAWMGVLAPRGLPPALVERLSAALRRIMDKPEVRQQVLALAAEPDYMDAEEFAASIDRESRRWADIIARINGREK